MDDVQRASEEIYRRIRQQAGLNRSSSAGDVTLRPEPIRVMTRGGPVLHQEASEQILMAQANIRDQSPGRTEIAGGGGLWGNFTVEHSTMLNGGGAE